MNPRCQYVLPLKKRCCKMQVKVGQIYCREHALFADLQKTAVEQDSTPKDTVNGT